MRSETPFWRVHETPCFPKSFKVNASDDPYDGDNSSDFYLTRIEAQLVADKRNEKEKD